MPVIADFVECRAGDVIIVKRKTSAKRMREALRRIKQALKRWRHLPIPVQGA